MALLTPGRCLEAIKDAGQWDNTIVFFTSDNGGAIVVNSVNNNYPLRGAKFSKFEGKEYASHHDGLSVADAQPLVWLHNGSACQPRR